MGSYCVLELQVSFFKGSGRNDGILNSRAHILAVVQPYISTRSMPINSNLCGEEIPVEFLPAPDRKFLVPFIPISLYGKFIQPVVRVG